MRASIVAFAMCTVFLVGACGSGTPTTASSSASSSAGSGATGDSVTIRGFAFNPQTVIVKVGQTVTFTNQDNQPHTATADKDGFDAGSIAAGMSTSQRFDTAGTFAYHCSFHPFMTGTITVSG